MKEQLFIEIQTKRSAHLTFFVVVLVQDYIILIRVFKLTKILPKNDSYHFYLAEKMIDLRFYFLAMKLLGCYTIFFLFSSLTICSQTIEPSRAVNKSTIQIEFESLYSIEKNGDEKHRTWSTPNATLRYGFFKNLELQINVPIFKKTTYMNHAFIHSVHEFEDSQLGLAINLWKDGKTITEGAFMVRTVVPVYEKLALNSLGSVISINLSKLLTDKLIFSINVGTITETYAGSTGFYIANLDFSPNPKIHLFLENQSDFESINTQFSNTLCTGFGFFFSDGLMLDLSVAKSLDKSFFYSGGTLTWVIVE